MSAARRKGNIDFEPLVAEARRVRARAYAPFSGYRVGAALLTRAGRVYTGTNVENSTYGATVCAERSAICAMVAAGEREPIACVIVTSGPQPGAPCGICRQTLAEFASDMPLLMVAEDAEGRITSSKRASLAALLPEAFRLEARTPRRPKRRAKALPQ